jgi:hypothetical protein
MAKDEKLETKRTTNATPSTMTEIAAHLHAIG